MDMESLGFNVSIAKFPCRLLKEADFIITATASNQYLLEPEAGLKTKLIVCVGADEKGKQELHPSFFQLPSIIVADYPQQCLQLGELQHSNLPLKKITPLGKVLEQGISNKHKLAIVDLTGIALQDVQMAKCVLQSL